MITKEKVVEYLVAIDEGVSDALHQHKARVQNEEKPSLYAGLIIGDALNEQTKAINNVAGAIRELAEKGIVVNVDTTTIAEAIATATANVTVTIKDLVEITNSIRNVATGIGKLDITNIINIGETAKKLQATANELEQTAKKLEVVERS